MSTLYKKILPPLPFILLTGVLWFHLQTMQEPLFFYREQQQIFLFDSTYIFSILKQIRYLFGYFQKCFYISPDHLIKR